VDLPHKTSSILRTLPRFNRPLSRRRLKPGWPARRGSPAGQAVSSPLPVPPDLLHNCIGHAIQTMPLTHQHLGREQFIHPRQLRRNPPAARRRQPAGEEGATTRQALDDAFKLASECQAALQILRLERGSISPHEFRDKEKNIVDQISLSIEDDQRLSEQYFLASGQVSRGLGLGS